MDADKLKDLTNAKANKNKPSARPKQAATGDYSQLYPGQQQAIDKLSDWYFSNELECTLEGVAGSGKTFILRYFLRILLISLILLRLLHTKLFEFLNLK